MAIIIMYSFMSALPFFTISCLNKTGNLAGADATEEEKVLAMMSQAGEEYNQAKLVYINTPLLDY